MIVESVLKLLFAPVLRKPRILSHGEDGDGIASAAIALRRYPNAVLALATPHEVQRAGRLSLINMVKWDVVLDLPCPRRAALWIDHHESNIPRAKKSIHDPRAPCAAVLAVKALDMEEDSLSVKLAQLAVETDTASIESAEGWLLNDAVKGSPAKMRVKLAKLLAEKGLDAFSVEEVAGWIEANRRIRENTEKLSERIEPLEITVLVVERGRSKKISYRGLMLSLEKRGARLVALCYRLSSRRWKVMLGCRGEFNCSKIAQALGGGGHRAASGATVEAESLEELLEVLGKVLPLSGARLVKISEAGDIEVVDMEGDARRLS
ncbi:MAG: Fis family transcriptional regulator [Thermoproteota archaeon]|nr:MAG: Fis family transcriptional regulator [Candidatus Korarchaeota archaeon]